VDAVNPVRKGKCCSTQSLGPFSSFLLGWSLCLVKVSPCPMIFPHSTRLDPPLKDRISIDVFFCPFFPTLSKTSPPRGYLPSPSDLIAQVGIWCFFFPLRPSLRILLPLEGLSGRPPRILPPPASALGELKTVSARSRFGPSSLPTHH